MPRDQEFRKAAKSELYPLLKSKEYSISLDYKERYRSRQEYSPVQHVPKQGSFATAIKELRGVIGVSPKLGFNSFFYVRFRDQKVGSPWPDPEGSLYLERVDYPVLAEHLDSVRIQGIGSEMTPNVGSMLCAGHTGLDTKWVRERVSIKADKSLQKYVKRANGLPLWLVVHSDGHAINQRIPKESRDLAINVCRDALDREKHGFTRAYWADLTAFNNVTWVGRII